MLLETNKKDQRIKSLLKQIVQRKINKKNGKYDAIQKAINKKKKKYVSIMSSFIILNPCRLN